MASTTILDSVMSSDSPLALFGTTAFMNGLHHIDSIGGLKIEDEVDLLLDVICSLGLQDLLCVDRLHKHYDVVDGEVPVYHLRKEAIKPSNKIASTTNSESFLFIEPRKVIQSSDGTALDKKSGAHLLPLSFAVSEGKLVVTSFLETAVEPTLAQACDALTKNFSVLSANHTAVQAMVKHVEGRGSETAKLIGVSLRLDVLFSGDNSEAVLKEDTYSNREQTLKLAKKDAVPNSSITTSWWVTEGKGGKPRTRACSRSCSWGPFKGHETYHTVS